MASPAPRWALLAGIVGSASVRALIPATFLTIVGLAIGVHFPGIDGLILGGTELSLILTEPTYAGLPVLDTTQIHVEAIVAMALTP